MRCRVEWRRRRGSKVDTQLHLFHNPSPDPSPNPSQVDTQLYLFRASRPDERVRNVLLAAKGALESSLVFEPVHGPGEYLLC